MSESMPPPVPQQPQQQPQIVIQQKSNRGCWIAAAIVGGIGVLLIGGCALMGGLFVGAVGEGLEEMSDEYESSNAIPDVSTAIGSQTTTSKFAILVTNVGSASHLKGGFSDATPATGGMYITVKWTYKNISSEPISSFSTPTIYLLSPEGTKYSADVDASSAFASMSNVDEKFMSDLNPGLQVFAADAFEVSSELFNQNPDGWRILVDADKNVTYPAR